MRLFAGTICGPGRDPADRSSVAILNQWLWTRRLSRANLLVDLPVDLELLLRCRRTCEVLRGKIHAHLAIAG